MAMRLSIQLRCRVEMGYWWSMLREMEGAMRYLLSEDQMDVMSSQLLCWLRKGCWSFMYFYYLLLLILSFYLLWMRQNLYNMIAHSFIKNIGIFWDSISSDIFFIANCGLLGSTDNKKQMFDMNWIKKIVYSICLHHRLIKVRLTLIKSFISPFHSIPSIQLFAIQPISQFHPYFYCREKLIISSLFNQYLTQMTAQELYRQDFNKKITAQDYMGMTLQNIVETNPQEKGHQEMHLDAGQLIKSAIYGGIDGTINSLIIIFSGIASNTTAYKIMTLVIALVLGDALSMGLGQYLSAKTEQEYIKSEQERQLYEVQNMVEKEKAEIIQIYEEKGYSNADSARVADLLATNSKAIVNVMMLQELGLVVSDGVAVWKNGLSTFISFIIFGILPAIPYIVTAGGMKSDTQHVGICIGIGIAQLISLGIAKARVIGMGAAKTLLSTIEMVIFGVVTIAVGYAIGVGFKA